MLVDNFLTIKEVAKKLRVSERSVMRYIKAKKLRASKMGQWRIKEEDLERFFNANINNYKKNHGRK
jgi:excisionase family DNA binding protein